MNSRDFAKYSSIIAILFSLTGLIYATYILFHQEPQERLFRHVLSSVSWCLLLWGSIIGFQTCRKYNLEEEDARFFGYIFCGILGIFICYISLTITGIVIALLLFFQILNRKKKIIQKDEALQEQNQEE